MPILTIPIHEANDCHHPAGSPVGGQFCSKKGWHLTSDPHFTPDPSFRPEWNSTVGDLMDIRPSGLFVTDAPEYWMQAHGYERPYVAQVEGVVTNPPGTIMHRGNEEFMQGEMRTVRVLTIDEYAREVFGEPGWVETHFDEPLRFGQPRKRMPKNYVGRAVADMTAAELKEWERKFKKWRRRPDGPWARQRRAEQL